MTVRPDLLFLVGLNEHLVMQVPRAQMLAQLQVIAQCLVMLPCQVSELKHRLLSSAPSAELHKRQVSAIDKPAFSSAGIGVPTVEEGPSGAALESFKVTTAAIRLLKYIEWHIAAPICASLLPLQIRTLDIIPACAIST